MIGYFLKLLDCQSVYGCQPVGDTKQIDETAWIENRIAALVAEHGAVPPPWFMFPNTHPYDIWWRMGDGENARIGFCMHGGRHKKTAR